MTDRLDQLLADLPAELEPDRDLWPAIEARLRDPSTAPARPAPWRLAVAALILVAATAAITASLVQPDTPAPAPAGLVATVDPADVVAEVEPADRGAAVEPADWQTEMRQANDVLAATIEQRRADLDPATLAVVEANLAIIDQAIAECASALEANPASGDLQEILLAVWRKKIDLLEQASRLPQA